MSAEKRQRTTNPLRRGSRTFLERFSTFARSPPHLTLCLEEKLSSSAFSRSPNQAESKGLTSCQRSWRPATSRSNVEIKQFHLTNSWSLPSRSNVNLEGLNRNLPGRGEIG